MALINREFSSDASSLPWEGVLCRVVRHHLDCSGQGVGRRRGIPLSYGARGYAYGGGVYAGHVFWHSSVM